MVFSGYIKSMGILDKRAFFFQGASLLVPEGVPDSEMDEPVPVEAAGDTEAADCFEIPSLDGCGSPIAVVSFPPGWDIPPGWRAVPVRQVLAILCERPAGGFMPDSPCFASNRLFRAVHIAQWRRESRYCGSCGSANANAPAELARVCPQCGRMEFPRIAPAVITIITNNEGKALLAHNTRFSPGVYSLIAGFNEPGESLEATVAREIREEVNIEVTDIRYAASQAWPFPHSLMLGFSARYASGRIRPDGIEIEDARWFGADELPKLPSAGSLSRYLIDRWLTGNS